MCDKNDQLLIFTNWSGDVSCLGSLAKKDKSLVADNRVLFLWSIPFPMFCEGKFIAERHRTISPPVSPISYISSCPMFCGEKFMVERYGRVLPASYTSRQCSVIWTVRQRLYLLKYKYKYKYKYKGQENAQSYELSDSGFIYSSNSEQQRFLNDKSRCSG